MKHPVRLLLLTGTALVMGAGIALAQMGPPPPPPDMWGGFGHGRMAERFMQDFDANHDGKVTKAEFDAGLAKKYAKLAGHNGGVTLDAFLAPHMQKFRQHTDDMFRRADWNANGRLSLEEFEVVPHAMFMRADKDGTGAISCKPHREGRHRRHRMGSPRMNEEGGRSMHRHHGGHGHWHGRSHWRGMGERCEQADLNHDGKVTRAELDQTIQKKFAEAARGGNAITPDEFYNLELKRFRAHAEKRFQRADTNHDGKLSEAEFDASAQKIFNRLDRNHDGVITGDELKRHHGHHGPHGDRHRGPGPE